MGPALNLALGTLVLGFLYLLFRTRGGWFWRWFGPKEDVERVQVEDALKHLYNSSESGLPGTIESIAGALQITCDTAARLAPQIAASLRRVLARNELRRMIGGARRRLRLRPNRVSRLTSRPAETLLSSRRVSPVP